MNKGIYILTAVHNDLEDTKKLLESIFVQTFKNFEVFIVDDGSNDGTSDYIHKNYPQANVIKGSGDLWWTGSLNLALRKILKIAGKDDYVWIINNDCYFDKNVLEKLLLYKKSIGGDKNIIGSRILDSETKKIVDNGVAINWSKLEFKSGGTDALSTKGTLYPISVFKTVGLFDEKHFPHYFSDYEFTIRAKRFGYGLAICPESEIYNRVERTGVGEIPPKSNIGDILNLLFSRKSKINLGLQINMIRYVCPKEFKLKNYFRLFTKIVKIIH